MHIAIRFAAVFTSTLLWITLWQHGVFVDKPLAPFSKLCLCRFLGVNKMLENFWQDKLWSIRCQALSVWVSRQLTYMVCIICNKMPGGGRYTKSYFGTFVGTIWSLTRFSSWASTVYCFYKWCYCFNSGYHLHVDNKKLFRIMEARNYFAIDANFSE